ncbi:hypothetical protein niasHT_011638 [Heterodera trifolii]|uniref:MATH domain-containing protein n=1 Tax=Heterodera trifolii TaxID=157864 RepID=A0ABD2LH37_9BILA
MSTSIRVRMKHLLITVVFEEMFRFDSQNEKPKNVSANCPVVEILDVEAAAFKVMLSFIYSDDFSELNGDNAIAVLYAAKKYNIPDLVDRSLQIPISELRNVFFAYTQALLFELEDYAIKCLRYICQNAVQLFGSGNFLQIDQNVLYNLLDSDRLLLSDEFELWKAALRWADEKCRQNGIECSSDNRRSVLGPALFKIRFPNIHEEDFAKCVVPSGLLTMEEVLGIYQFNSHPFLYLHGVLGLYSLKFPSHGRIFNWNKANDNRRGTLALEIEKISKFSGEAFWSSRFSDAINIKGLAWKIEAKIRKNTEGTDENCLGFYLWCDAKERGPWNCVFSATFRIVLEENNGVENFIGTFCDHIFDNKSYNLGVENFITFVELMEPRNGFYNREKDKVTLAIDVTVKDQKTEKFISDPNKSKGTLSMEIENLSEFAREIIWSERKSETVYIKGFPWKIWAQIEKKDENIGKEKWLGISLLCDAPKEDKKWSCKFLATFRIVSQKKNSVPDFKREFDEHVFDNKKNSCGCANFISFAELMDPSKGFYDKSEDKVIFAIDVTVKDEKTEDKPKKKQ